MCATLSETTHLCQVTMFNGLVERCFANCVHSFQGKTLDSKEERVSPSPTPTQPSSAHTLNPQPSTLNYNS